MRVPRSRLLTPTARLARLLALLLLLVPAARAQTASFQGLGDLPGGSYASRGIGVSGDGRVVVGFATDSEGPQASRWTAESGMLGIGEFAGGIYDGSAVAASGDGAVVVGRSGGESGQLESFRWTAQTGLVPLGVLPESNGVDVQTRAGDVTPDGTVIVGGGSVDGGDVAFRWTAPAGLQSIGDLPGGQLSSFAEAVSDDGTVVVGSGSSESGTQPSRVEAFRWSAAGGMVGLGDLPGGSFSSQARDVSADGSVAVGRGSSAAGPISEAFRWTSTGGMQALGDLPGSTHRSDAYAVSADGSVVVGFGTISVEGVAQTAAFIWTAETGMRDLRTVLVTDYGLDLTGWRLSAAYGISADGRTIVGLGVGPTGGSEAWRAVLSTGTTALPDAPTAATSLAPVAPNPVAGPAAVRFQFATASRVHLAVYDVLGREVALLVDAERLAGLHMAALDASRLAPGVYVVRLSAGADVRSQRLTVAR